MHFFFGGGEEEGGGGVNKVYHVQCENGELTCLLLTQGSNVSVQIHPTLLAAACYWCCLLFDDVDSIEFKRLGPFKWIKHHPPLLGHHVECVQIGPAILPHPPTTPCPKQKSSSSITAVHFLEKYAMMQVYICVSFLF